VFTRRTDLSVGPEVGDCLRARLVRLMTSPNAQLKIMSADFLWVICNQNGMMCPSLLVEIHRCCAVVFARELHMCVPCNIIRLLCMLCAFLYILSSA